jgi:hypothetical protein
MLTGALKRQGARQLTETRGFARNLGVARAVRRDGQSQSALSPLAFLHNSKLGLPMSHLGLGCVKTRRRAIVIEEVIRPSLFSRSKRKRIQLTDQTEKYHSSSRFDFCVFTQPGSLADIRRARGDVRSAPEADIRVTHRHV